MISGSGLSRSGRLLVKFSEITSRTSDLSDLLSWFCGFLLFLPFGLQTTLKWIFDFVIGL